MNAIYKSILVTYSFIDFSTGSIRLCAHQDESFFSNLRNFDRYLLVKAFNFPKQNL